MAAAGLPPLEPTAGSILRFRVFAPESPTGATQPQNVTTVLIDFPACINSNASLIRSSGST
jgi:hypothetical protein